MVTSDQNVKNYTVHALWSPILCSAWPTLCIVLVRRRCSHWEVSCWLCLVAEKGTNISSLQVLGMMLDVFTDEGSHGVVTVVVALKIYMNLKV